MATNSQTQKGAGPAHYHSYHYPHVTIEMMQNVYNAEDNLQNKIEQGAGAVKVVSGLRAFREYDLLKGVPKLNRVGGLRGMVVNRNARVVFDVAADAAEAAKVFGWVMLVASLAMETYKERQRIETILGSAESTGAKTEKVGVIAGLIVTRAVAGPIVPIVHFVADKVAAALALGHAPKAWVRDIHSADHVVSSRYQAITNDDNALNAADRVLHYVKVDVSSRR